MLKELKIKNIAIIDECTISFGQGFNVLTGETGAGKSIIIDSLEFVLGARADKTLIKAGAGNATVTGVFDISDNAGISDIFDSLGLEYDDTIVISRTMNIAGKNECRINGELTSLNVIKKLTNHMADIFGQHDSMTLLDENRHIEILDNICPDQINTLKDQINTCLDQIKDIEMQIESLGGIGADRERNIDILKYQIAEIDDSKVYEGEDEQLNAKLIKLQNSERIAELIDNSINLIDGDYSLIGALKNAANNLDILSKYGITFEELSKRAQSAKYEIQDIVDTLSQELKATEYSKQDINDVIDRLETIKDLSRKYGKTIPDILEYKKQAEDKLNLLINAEESIAKLNLEKSKIIKNVANIASELTILRKSVAKDLSAKVIVELKSLGMKNAMFDVQFDDYDSSNIMGYITPNGADKLRFMFSANLGVPLAPLSRIISGGEMSRFMLAFKCVTGGENKTYVFDEIDAGIGGETAIVVAKKLAQISRSSQVLCVTHLAQIAAFGDENFLIEKTEKDKTITRVIKLDDNSKQDEITRMIGSVNSKEYANKHAAELIREARQVKLNNN